jgi:hypothetical protein
VSALPNSFFIVAVVKSQILKVDELLFFVKFIIRSLDILYFIHIWWISTNIFLLSPRSSPVPAPDQSKSSTGLNGKTSSSTSILPQPSATLLSTARKETQSVESDKDISETTKSDDKNKTGRPPMVFKCSKCFKDVEGLRNMAAHKRQCGVQGKCDFHWKTVCFEINLT